ncbi:MAG: peptidoglycan DD-metalloendopeptidase family protein [Dysgonamonadaceae bacterium]|jgi:septal ring factor EnvC (AmiA/AmiB activator)|nr:peptidoglycan DD-metalloendopeptidase family protein [Dysgonamonadaceae bacterium]
MRIQGVIILLLITFTVTAQQQSVRTRELEAQRKTLLAEIENTDQLLNENKKSISSVLHNLNLLVQQIEARKKLIMVLEKEIRVLDEEIRFKEFQIKKLDRNLRQKKDNYAVSVQKMYQQKNNQGQLLFVLSADNMAQSFRRMLYLKEYAGWRKQQADEIMAQQQKVTKEKQALSADKLTKEVLADTKKNEEKRLLKEENAKKTEVAGLQKDAKKLQSEMDKKKKQAADLDRKIARIIAEEVNKANKAAKAEPKTERKAETAGGYAMTKEEQALSSNFIGNKGKLPLPLEGNYKIIKRFGQQQYGDLKNTHFNSNGIEFKTTPGMNARVVFDGEVTKVFIVPGFQNSVIVRHGNYLTLYSCLEQVFVKQGDKIKTGQNIGKIYTDAEGDNETVLYFEVRKDKTPLNPEPWLNM